MINWVEILTSPTADVGALLLVHFDNRRYIFGNVSEATQRALIQRRTSLRNLEDIFLTGPVDWSNTGGLMGLILSTADVAANAKAAVDEENEKRAAKGRTIRPGKPESPLNIHGAKNLTHMLATTRKFVFRQGFPLRPHEIRSDARANGIQTAEPDWQDDHLRIWHVPIEHRALKSRKRSHDDLSDNDNMVDVSSSSQTKNPVSASSGSGAPNPSPEEEEKEEVAHQARTAIVKDMFDSNWRLDSLHEVWLHEVEMPATVFVRDGKGHIVKYEGPMPGGKDPVPEDTKVLIRNPWPSSAISSLPSTTPSLDSMSYIVKNQSRRGKFRADEAERLGLVRGDFKRVIDGQSVAARNGNIITRDMVLEPSIEGHGFAVVDIPSLNYIDGFLSRPEWSCNDIMKGVDAMYWITRTPQVLEDPRIMSFMRERSNMRHTVLASGMGSNHITFRGATAQAIQLNRIDPERFPLLTYSNKAARPPSSPGGSSPLFRISNSGAALQLAPQVIFKDDKAIPFMNTAKPLKELASVPKVLALADKAKAKISNPNFLVKAEAANEGIPNLDTEIIAIGTGSAQPSKYRNVSATLIRVPDHGGYLLDCGEGTLGQLRRMFGFDGADEIIKDLRAIWISHLHADHHLGTISILRRYRDLHLNDPAYDAGSQRKLGVFCHAQFEEFLDEYKSVEAYHSPAVQVIPMNMQNVSETTKSAYFLEGEQSLPFGLSRIEACLVPHCFGSMGVALTLPSGLKIAYSGDCRPSSSLVEIGLDAHLLVHECTFDDELAGNALAKKHSTLSEAMGVARNMRARRVLLTHFSQRYPKIPIIGHNGLDSNTASSSVVVDAVAAVAAAGTNDGATSVQGPVQSSYLFAFDYMRVRLGDFKKAEAFLPALRELWDGTNTE